MAQSVSHKLIFQTTESFDFLIVNTIKGTFSSVLLVTQFLSCILNSLCFTDNVGSPSVLGLPDKIQTT